MKKILLSLVVLLMSSCVMSSCAHGLMGGPVAIPLELIHTDAALAQFKRASKFNQAEILSEFIRQANEAYAKCETIDEIRDLRENVVLIDRYLRSGKKSFMTVQKDYNIIYNKINKTIREYEKGTTVYHETGGYYDFERAE